MHLLILNFLLCISTLTLAEVNLDALFPGSQLTRHGSVGDNSALGYSYGYNPAQFGHRYLREDENFQYYHHGSGVYRLYKKPQPRMSHGDARSIPQAPTLFWPGVYEFVGDDSAPARPNCSEENFGVEDYLNLVNDKSIRTKADFLKRIPKYALQKFTFLHTSKSLQRYGISKLTPRVLRFANNGKMIISYTTNKETKGFNTVEAIYFDDKTRRYNFIHSDFVSESDIENQSKSSKTVMNPKACFACHGGLDPRPNWQPYAFWNDAFGIDDDLPSNNEWHEYAQMRANLKGTPELETLPWPAETSTLHRTFPYITTEKEGNYNLRPNAHLTIVSSRVNANRVARKMEESPVYNKIKWTLLSRALGCHSDATKNPLFEALLLKNKFNSDQKEYEQYNINRSYSSSLPEASALYDFGEGLLFNDTDWNLTFNPRPERIYKYYHTAQWHMSEFTLSVLFKNLAKEEPKLKPFDVRINRMSVLFGEKFYCLDEIADKLWLGPQTFKMACDIVQKKATEEVAAHTTTDMSLVDRISNPTWDPEPERTGFGFATVAKGEKIVTQMCANCHEGKAIPFNFKTLEFLKSPTFKERKEGLFKVIESAMGTEDSCRMPLPIAGKCLSDTERQSVLKYLESQIPKE